MADKKQLEHGFMVMYEKDGYYYGSYDLFPSKDDVKLIKVPVWRGHEEQKQLDITKNGTYNVIDASQITVEVPGATTKDLFEIDANGKYNIADYARVAVNVPNPSSGELAINANGNYDVTEKASVAVNVPNPSTGTLEITENGEYNVTEKAGVNVNVAGLVPTGNKQITTTAQTDVTEFATAQVVDANLIAENIKKDVTILGITGTLAGGSGDLDELMQETF